GKRIASSTADPLIALEQRKDNHLNKGSPSTYA
ncbi:unnamed protein product, partial [marine sediment metagenome]